MMPAEVSRAIRIAGLLAVVISLLVLLTACGGGGDDEPGPPDLRGINPPQCAASAPVCQ